MDQSLAVLTNAGRYSKFTYKGKTITFRTGKDLIKYLRVKNWEDGYLVVDCLGKAKGQYEDYIDMTYILKCMRCGKPTAITAFMNSKTKHATDPFFTGR